MDLVVCRALFMEMRIVELVTYLEYVQEYHKYVLDVSCYFGGGSK